jgi:membrane protein required for colicin V production
MDIATIDIAIVFIVAASGVISMIRGFVKEAMALVIWLSAFVVAMSFKEVVAELLANVIVLASIRQLAAWGILFVGTLLIGAMVNFLLGKLVSSTGLSGTDRTLGLVFGVFRGLLVVLALVIIVPKALPVDQDSWWTASSLIPLFQSFEEVGREAAAAFSDFIMGWI